ncbi:MAG: hypothetical protein RLY93_14475 [Sumerlaeia bacterium]
MSLCLCGKIFLPITFVLLLAGCSPQPGATPPSAVLGHQGRAPGAFSKPRAIAIDGLNRLAVIDRTGRIQTFDLRTLALLEEWELPSYSNGTPTGMTLDPVDDTIWLADTHYQRILHYGWDGTLLGSFGESGTGPGQMIFPTDVALDPDGETLWVVEYGHRARLMQFTRGGDFVREWTTEPYEYTDAQRPQALAIGEDGLIYVADAGVNRVLVFSREGELLRSWGEAGNAAGELWFPYDIALGPDRTLYISEWGNSRVSHFTQEGEFLGFWGIPGHDPGMLWQPWGVAIGPGGQLAVADTENHRVQLIDRPEKDFTKGTQI